VMMPNCKAERQSEVSSSVIGLIGALSLLFHEHMPPNSLQAAPWGLPEQGRHAPHKGAGALANPKGCLPVLHTVQTANRCRTALIRQIKVMLLSARRGSATWL
jgi:hypothetical protein